MADGPASRRRPLFSAQSLSVRVSAPPIAISRRVRSVGSLSALSPHSLTPPHPVPPPSRSLIRESLRFETERRWIRCSPHKEYAESEWMSVSVASVRAPTVLNQFGRALTRAPRLFHQRCSHLVCTPDIRPGRVPHSSKVSCFAGRAAVTDVVTLRHLQKR